MSAEEKNQPAYNNQNSDDPKKPNDDQHFPQDQRAEEIRKDPTRKKEV